MLLYTGIVTFADSVAQRKPVRHHYGSIVGQLGDPFRRRYIQYESGLERSWLQILIASPRVRNIQEQQLLRIPLGNGQWVNHWVDLVVEWTDGTVTAYACKYERDTTDELRDLLKQAGDHVGDAFADVYATLSEVGLTSTRVWNARRVISCALDFDLDAQRAIREALPSLGRQVSLAWCDAIVGDGVRGSRAAIALIQRGLLGVGAGERIGFITELRNLFTN